MSNICLNTLYVKGNTDSVSKFFDYINEIVDIGSYFFNLEKEAEDIEDDLDLPCASQRPLPDTFTVDVDSKTISWEANNYPSILAIHKLSSHFTDVDFTLDFDNTEEELVGYISICNSIISDIHLVDFDNAIQTLFSNYGIRIMSLRLNEKIQVGLGMIDIKCIDEEDTEDEIIKKFSIVFQCDSSPVVIIRIPKEDDDISLDTDFMNGDWDDWEPDEIEYSDNEGNEEVWDNSCYREMCVHSEKPFPHYS